MIKLTIPGEPVAKGRPRMTKAGIAYTPKKTVNYETLVKELFIIGNPGHTPLEGQLNARVRAYFGIPKSWSKKKQQEALQGNLRPTKRPDIDNLIKSCLDSLNGIAFDDDSQVVDIEASKWYSDKPRVEIELGRVEA